MHKVSLHPSLSYIDGSTRTQFSLFLPQYPLASQLLYTNTAIMVILLTFLDDSPFVLVSQFLSIFPCMNAPCTQITKFLGRFERGELEQGHLHISAGIFKQSMGARNRVGIALSYWPARLHRLAELIPWNRFLGSLKVYKFRLWIGILGVGVALAKSRLFFN